MQIVVGIVNVLVGGSLNKTVCVYIQYEKYVVVVFLCGTQQWGDDFSNKIQYGGAGN